SVAKGTPEGLAEAQMVQADLDVVQLALTAVLMDISSGAPASQLQMDLQTLHTDLINFEKAEFELAVDTLHDIHNGTLRAAALSGGGGSTLHLQARDEVFAEFATLAHELHGDI